MTYTESVDQAAHALTRGETAQQTVDEARWELARLTFENTYAHGVNQYKKPDRQVSIAQWAADIRAATHGLYSFSAPTAQTYRAIWKLKVDTYPGTYPRWIDVYNEVRGKTPRERIAEYEAGGEKSTPENRVALFQHLARDPAVIEDAARLGTPTSRAVSELQEQTHVIRERQREQMIEADPVGRSLERMRGSEGIDALCIRFFTDAKKFTSDLRAASVDAGPVGAQQTVFITELVRYLRSLADHLEQMADGEQTEIDAFLGDVLGGGRHGSRP